jgi:hypothetical protein
MEDAKNDNMKEAMDSLNISLEGIDEIDSLDSLKKRFLLVYRNTVVSIKTACQIAGIGRATFYTWLEKDAVFEKCVEVLKEERIDSVEEQLMTFIKGKTKKTYLLDSQGRIFLDEKGKPVETEQVIIHPNLIATMFFLKTQAKKRGYIEQTDSRNEHNFSQKKGFILDFVNAITREEIEEIRE